jgi:pimeloyl-ACP methyl ester carboxylesterase
MRSLILAGFVGAAACTAARQQAPASTNALSVATAPGVSLEVIDWGGDGDIPLVFLAGLGHTAREFDSFAPSFADEFRVFGITRRGAGGSSDVAPEDLDDLVEDIAAVLDTLDLPEAVLIGHSFAGSEMAAFGQAHSDRCAGLIYLDSAYNYTDLELARLFQSTPPPQAPPMQPSDSVSVQAVQAYFEHVSGFTLPESELQATNRFDSDGRLVGSRRTATSRQMGSMQRAPRWEDIECPSLGVYAVPAPLETWLPYYDQLNEAQRERGAQYVEAFGRWTRSHREEFGRWPQNQIIEFPSSNHYFFLEQPDEAARLIREFLRNL